jgi:acyl-coenzyme A synthetase/AMP-(fatty) acid ligase
MLGHEEPAGKPGLDLSSIRFSLSAGEALPEPLLRSWLERTNSDVYDGIGSAEMFHIYASNRPGDIKPGSLGKVVEGYELRVLPEEAEGVGEPAEADHLRIVAEPDDVFDSVLVGKRSHNLFEVVLRGIHGATPERRDAQQGEG